MKRKLFLSMLSVALSTVSSPQTISTISGIDTAGFSGDGGPATAAELWAPTCVAADGIGNIYIADYDNNRIRVINTAGIINTLAGSSSIGFSGDGGPSTAAELANPKGVAVDSSGNIYISDQGNQRTRIMNTAGIINTFAGNGSIGYSGDGGQATAAEIYEPYGVAFDASASVYIADGNNVIRKVNSNGIISTIAGNGIYGYSGDGGAATAAELNNPSNLCVDASGNIYIADLLNNRIRMVDTSGIIETFAGNGDGAFSGDGGSATAAEIDNPICLAIDASGNIYTGDFLNNRVRKINTSNIISTFAGNGIAGFSGDGGPATAAEINGGWGITVGASGNFYIADWANARIRKISPIITDINEHTYSDYVNIFPVPSSGYINAELNGTGYRGIDIYDVFGQKIYSQTLNAKQNDLHLAVDISGVSQGVYFMQIFTQRGILNKRVIIVK